MNVAVGSFCQVVDLLAPWVPVEQHLVPGEVVCNVPSDLTRLIAQCCRCAAFPGAAVLPQSEQLAILREVLPGDVNVINVFIFLGLVGSSPAPGVDQNRWPFRGEVLGHVKPRLEAIVVPPSALLVDPSAILVLILIAHHG